MTARGLKSESGAAEQAARRYPVVTSRAHADLLAVSLMFVFVMSAITLALMPIVTNQLRNQVGLNDAQIGLLTSVFMGFYGATGFFSGIAAARWGGRLLALSSACFVVGSLLFAFSSSFPGFLAGRAIQGLGGGMVVATINPVLAHALPRKWLSRAWGIIGIGFGFGSMIALFALPPIQAAGGYRAVCLTTAGLGVVIGATALTNKAVRALPVHENRAAGLIGMVKTQGTVLGNYRVRMLGLCNTAGLAMGVGVMAWAPSFLQDTYHASETTSLYIVATLGIAQMIGNPLGAMASGRWGKYRVTVGSLVVFVIVTVLPGLVPGIPLVAALVFLGAFFGMFYFPAMLAYIPEVVRNPAHVGPATGVNSSMGFVGSLVAPWIFGLILDAGGQSTRSYVGGFAMLGLFGVVSLIGLVFFRPGAIAGATGAAPRGPSEPEA